MGRSVVDLIVTQTVQLFEELIWQEPAISVEKAPFTGTASATRTILPNGVGIPTFIASMLSSKAAARRCVCARPASAPAKFRKLPDRLLDFRNQIHLDRRITRETRDLDGG